MKRAAQLFSVIGLLILAAVFVTAGGLKALNPAAFAEQIRNYRLLPWPLVAALALYLPGLEVIAGAALLWPRMRKGALLLVGAMLVAFLAALISAAARGLNIDCGCFGAATTRGLASAIGEDVALLALTCWLARRESRSCPESA